MVRNETPPTVLRKRGWLSHMKASEEVRRENLPRMDENDRLKEIERPVAPGQTPTDDSGTKGRIQHRQDERSEEPSIGGIQQKIFEPQDRRKDLQARTRASELAIANGGK